MSLPISAAGIARHTAADERMRRRKLHGKEHLLGSFLGKEVEKEANALCPPHQQAGGSEMVRPYFVSPQMSTFTSSHQYTRTASSAVVLRLFLEQLTTS